MGPRNDGKIRIGCARLLNDLAAFEGVGDGNEEAAAPCRELAARPLRVGGIAGDGLDALLAERRAASVVALDDERDPIAGADPRS